MAVTSIWPIKGRIAPVIEYARNPGKTIETSREQAAALHQIDGVLEYAANNMKTETREDGSGINCSEEIAAQQFKDTKKKKKTIWIFLGLQDTLEICYEQIRQTRLITEIGKIVINLNSKDETLLC